MSSIGGLHFDHVRVDPNRLTPAPVSDPGTVDGTAGDGTSSPPANPPFINTEQTGTGGQQSSQNLPPPLLSGQTSAELIAAQAQAQGTAATAAPTDTIAPVSTTQTPPPPIVASPLTQIEQKLFSQVDSNNDGSITKSDLEAAVTKDGGTAKAADALFAKLDPNGTGSVDAQQFQKGVTHLARHAGRHGHEDGGNSAQDALQALLDPSAQGASGTAANTSSSSGNSAADALIALLQGATATT